MSDQTNEPLVQVGWYCWRCQAVNAQPCRSDCVPVHVPAEWADEMTAEILRREEEPDDDPAVCDHDSQIINHEGAQYWACMKCGTNLGRIEETSATRQEPADGPGSVPQAPDGEAVTDRDPTEAGRAWMRGELSSDDYFALVRRRNQQ